MRTMTAGLKTMLIGIAALGVLWPGTSRDVLAHGKDLAKKQGGGAATFELGPHGGAAIDIGDGHFELVREAAGALALYRLDTDLKAIPAEDVDAAQIYAITPGGPTVNFAMTAVRSDSAPLHFSVTPKIDQRGGYLAVVSVAMGEESRNLRFQVKGT